jgi:hypothetical protein
MSTQISALLKDLRSLRDPHLEIGRSVFGPKGGPLWAFDFLGIATMNRSLSLLRGFCDLIESKNFICAASLVRLQLDNCIRFSAAWLVKDPYEFARCVMNGTPIRDIRDNDKKKLTDAYCVAKLSETRPWVGEVYAGTSGYIHLSEKHIFNAIGLGEGDGEITMKISAHDHFVTESHYVEAIRRI